MALKWVHDNIASFGGNCSEVTIFGQSAGAKSADRMVLSPPFPGAFRAAILQSDVATFGNNIPHDVSAWNSLTHQVGCHREHKNLELGCMRDRTSASTIQANIQGLEFVQITDNVTKLTTPNFRNNNQTVPILLGSNGQEARVFRVTKDKNNLQACSDAFSPHTLTDLTEIYGPITDQHTDFDAVSELFTDLDFQCPVAFTSNFSLAAKFPTWRYIFNASFPNTNPDKALEDLGYDDDSFLDLEAWHTSEIQYVFGNLPPSSVAAQYELSSQIQTAWANFAKDPYVKGPGWQQANKGIMVLGGNQSSSMTFQNGFQLDSRCHVWRDYLNHPPHGSEKPTC